MTPQRGYFFTECVIQSLIKGSTSRVFLVAQIRTYCYGHVLVLAYAIKVAIRYEEDWLEFSIEQ